MYIYIITYIHAIYHAYIYRLYVGSKHYEYIQNANSMYFLIVKLHKQLSKSNKAERKKYIARFFFIFRESI